MYLAETAGRIGDAKTATIVRLDAAARPAHAFVMALSRTSTLLAALALLGCARDAVVLEQPIGQTHTTTSATGGARPVGTDDPNEAIGVVIDESLRVACNLTHHETPPRFAVEKSRLRPLGDDVLAAVARCLAGDKRDAGLSIVGHADHRGADEYNDKLGLLRAQRARDVIVGHGVATERIAVTSRGARDAKGTDAASWSADHRVELVLSAPRAQAGLEMPMPIATEAPPSAAPTPMQPIPGIRARPTIRTEGVIPAPAPAPAAKP